MMFRTIARPVRQERSIGVASGAAALASESPRFCRRQTHRAARQKNQIARRPPMHPVLLSLGHVCVHLQCALRSHLWLKLVCCSLHGCRSASMSSVLGATQPASEDLFHPCVDCGTRTGSFCDYCFAADRLPAQWWAHEQPTPLCSECDDAWDMCKYCRTERVFESGRIDADDPHLLAYYCHIMRLFEACKSGGAAGSTEGRPDTQAPGQDPRARRPRKVRTCFGCLKQFAPTGPWKCPCRLAHYCGTACQREHWAVHKPCCTTYAFLRRRSPSDSGAQRASGAAALASEPAAPARAHGTSQPGDQ